MDSDTLVYNDMTKFLYTFIKQEVKRNSPETHIFKVHLPPHSKSQKSKSIMLVRDHAMSDAKLAERWRTIAVDAAQQANVCAIPQACVMAFKRRAAAPLFAAWRQAWNEFLTPRPFATIADPSGGARHAPFCIEQYALALAVTRLAMARDVCWFERGAARVRPSSLPAAPVLPSRFGLAEGFGAMVARRWADFGSGVDQQLSVEAQLADAAADVRLRPGAEVLLLLICRALVRCMLMLF
jgi:hypothetical protein